MKKKIFWTVLSFLFLSFFVGFTYLAKTQILKQIDFDTTVRLQNHIPTKFDGLLSAFSLIGSFEIINIILLAIIFARRKLSSLLIFIPFLTAHVIETIGKAIFYHPGPPYMFFRYNLNFLFPSSYIQPGSSYPSGHALRGVFISLIFIYLIGISKLKSDKKLFLYLSIIAVNSIMLISRVSLGEHWTTDVIGGGLLGVSTAFFSFIFL